MFESQEREAYPVSLGIGIEDLVFNRQGIEGWETALLGFVEEIFLGQDLNDVVCCLVVFQP